MNFVYLVFLFFGVMGLWVLLYDVPGLLLYHKKVQARAKKGKKYSSTRAQIKIQNEARGQYGKPNGPIHYKSRSLYTKKTEMKSWHQQLTL